MLLADLIAARRSLDAFFAHAAINSTRVSHPESSIDGFAGYPLRVLFEVLNPIDLMLRD
jgi:hypothetical protein